LAPGDATRRRRRRSVVDRYGILLYDFSGWCSLAVSPVDPLWSFAHAAPEVGLTRRTKAWSPHSVGAPIC